jgi:hypothetical protein
MLNKQVRIQFSSPLSLTEITTLIIGLCQYPFIKAQADNLDFNKYISTYRDALPRWLWSQIQQLEQQKIDRNIWPDIIETKLSEILRISKKLSDEDIEAGISNGQDDDFSAASSDIFVNHIFWFLNKENGLLKFWRNWNIKRSETGEDLLPSSYIVSLLKKFLANKVSQDLLATLSSSENIVIENLDEFLKDTAKRVSVIDTQMVKDVSNSNWMPNVRRIVSSGFTAVDELLRGGLASGEVGGILGYYGGGKTTLAVQLLVNYGLREYQKRQNDETYIYKHYFLYTFEVSADRLAEIAHSYLAKIPLSKLRKLTDISQLADVFGACDYEKKNMSKFIAANMVMSERERFEYSRNLLSRLPIHFIDVVEVDKEDLGISFVCSSVEHMAAKYEIGGVIIDYVRAMMEMSPESRDQFSFRTAIGSCPTIFKKYIAKKYNCIVWLFHQFGTEANRRKPEMADHTFAAEARNFAEKLDACLCISAPSLITSADNTIKTGRYTRLYCTKLRYDPIDENDRILYFDEIEGGFIDVSHIIGYDRENKMYYAKATEGDEHESGSSIV